MKIFLCLFSLYILLLAGVPCRADDDCCPDNVAAKGHPKYPQPCSPFFACGTCHGFVVPAFELSLPERQPAAVVRQAVYKDQPLPEFHGSIWQPPKAVMA